MGVSLDLSYECQVYDNCINQFNSAVAVAGASLQTRTYRNDFSDNLIGFYLHDYGRTGLNEYLHVDDVNFVVWRLPQDNKWNRASTDTWQTYVQNADGIQSPWRFRSQPNSLSLEFQADLSPLTGSGEATASSRIPFLQPNNPSLFINTGTPCSTAFLIDSNVVIEPSANASTDLMVELLNEFAVQLHEYLPAHEQFLVEQQIYYQVIEDTIDYSNSASLTDLMSRATGSDIEKMHNLEETIDEMMVDGSAQSIATLQALAQQIAGSSFPSQLSQQFYELYIPLLTDSVYSLPKESIDSLYSWAQKCPYIFGQAVYQSRALLAEVEDTLMGKTSCEMAYTYAQASTKTDATDPLDAQNQVLVYPNPVTQGLEYHLVFDSPQLEIKLFQMNGILVDHQKHSGELEWTMHSGMLTTGIYQGQAIGINGQLTYFKLCVTQ